MKIPMRRGQKKLDGCQWRYLVGEGIVAYSLGALGPVRSVEKVSKGRLTTVWVCGVGMLVGLGVVVAADVGVGGWRANACCRTVQGICAEKEADHSHEAGHWETVLM